MLSLSCFSSSLRHELSSARRCFSASASRAGSELAKVPPAIYISDSHNPFFNLAFEEWIFRKTDPDSIVLYMYRNSASVIIGRNQNPWKEINLERLGELGIPFVRRKSGGGTVYHDLGNTNYCVYVPRLQFERKKNAELVVRALNRLEIPAFVNDRNDICVDAFKIGPPLPLFFSRSAFKLVNARAYHHGTMLLDTKLADLKGVLGNSKSTMVTKGVASVPSPVRNLREWSDSINHEAFVGAVVGEFKDAYGGESEVHRVDESELDRNDFAKKVYEELHSWDWMYGQTPEFSHSITIPSPAGPITYEVKSRHGLITSAELSTAPNQADWWRSAEAVSKVLEGDRYGSLEESRRVVGEIVGLKGGRARVLIKALQKEM